MFCYLCFDLISGIGRKAQDDQLLISDNEGFLTLLSIANDLETHLCLPRCCSHLQPDNPIPHNQCLVQCGQGCRRWQRLISCFGTPTKNPIRLSKGPPPAPEQGGFLVQLSITHLRMSWNVFSSAIAYSFYISQIIYSFF